MEKGSNKVQQTLSKMMQIDRNQLVATNPITSGQNLKENSTTSNTLEPVAPAQLPVYTESFLNNLISEK